MEKVYDTKTLEEKVVEEMRFLGIRLGKVMYGIPVEKTREVVKPQPVTNVPGTAPHIIGLINLHGEILCVVDINIILNTGKTNLTDNSRIVIIKTTAGPVGVFCDEVIDIYNIPKKNTEGLSALNSEKGNYINGQVKTRDGLMDILDIEKLLFKQEK